MTAERSIGEPKTFFLNERHELARGERSGGGQSAKLGAINWVEKARSVGSSLNESRLALENSVDPAVKQHFFLVATPVAGVPKLSTDTKKAPTGTFLEVPDYSGDHSRVFRRLGMDLIDVSLSGAALVHATPERFDRIAATASNLAREKVQEQARWATIERFSTIPSSFRVDESWLLTLDARASADVIIELQPLLSRAESADVVAAILRLFKPKQNDVLLGSGVDFSGRRWFRGKMQISTVRAVAEAFSSVQSLHPPFNSCVVASSRSKRSAAASSSTATTPVSAEYLAGLPIVAVVDTGCPVTHVELAPYRSGVGYRHPDAYSQYAGDHGSWVASRIVFGPLDFQEGLQERPPGTCRFFDVMVAEDEQSVVDKAIAPAMEAVVATAPDVRVFNMSFGDVRPLTLLSDVELREKLILVQDLDNFVFARDVVVAFASGNSPANMIPTKPYPLHLDEPAWQMGAWPGGFNTLSCGAFVDVLHSGVIARGIGWPSPLSRVGPGLAAAPKPDFSAAGGNLDEEWKWRPNLGVWCCNAAGDWEDKVGTSFAAPLLAREVALTLQRLQPFCPVGSRAYGVTVKALLALTASSRATLPPAVELLAKRTLGRGAPDTSRIFAPRPDSALFVWQGVIEGPDDIVRVQIPIPVGWLEIAAQPSLRLVCSWDPPVNEAARGVWACRKVSAQLRPGPGQPALRGSTVTHGSYPLIDRKYSLDSKRLGKYESDVLTDTWTLELSYEQIAEYAAGITFSPQQRVAFAAELIDDAASPISPQSAIRLLPASTTMVRLSVTAMPIAAPIVIRRG